MPVHSQVPTSIDLSKLRPCDVIRLLNGSDYGEVISERQLRRHRGRAGFVGRRIDLNQYVAWLLEQRHSTEREDSYDRLRRITKSKQRRTAGGAIKAHEVIDLIEQQDRRCALTGRRLKPKNAALDHITPVSRGGTHQIENAQILDKAVNRAKGTMNNDEFIELCCAVARYAKRRQKAKQMEVA